MERAGLIGIAEPGLLSVGARDPAEKMVERAVLHRQDDDVTDGRRFLPRRKALLRRLARGGIAASGDECDEQQRSERRILAAHESLLPDERALRDAAEDRRAL